MGLYEPAPHLSSSGWRLDLGSAGALGGSEAPQTFSGWAASEPYFIPEMPPRNLPAHVRQRRKGWEPPSQVENLGFSL